MLLFISTPSYKRTSSLMELHPGVLQLSSAFFQSYILIIIRLRPTTNPAGKTDKHADPDLHNICIRNRSRNTPIRGHPPIIRANQQFLNKIGPNEMSLCSIQRGSGPEPAHSTSLMHAYLRGWRSVVAGPDQLSPGVWDLKVGISPRPANAAASSQYCDERLAHIRRSVL